MKLFIIFCGIIQVASITVTNPDNEQNFCVESQEAKPSISSLIEKLEIVIGGSAFGTRQFHIGESLDALSCKSSSDVHLAAYSIFQFVFSKLAWDINGNSVISIRLNFHRKTCVKICSKFSTRPYEIFLKSQIDYMKISITSFSIMTFLFVSYFAKKMPVLQSLFVVMSSFIVWLGSFLILANNLHYLLETTRTINKLKLLIILLCLSTFSPLLQEGAITSHLRTYLFVSTIIICFVSGVLFSYLYSNINEKSHNFIIFLIKVICLLVIFYCQSDDPFCSTLLCIILLLVSLLQEKSQNIDFTALFRFLQRDGNLINEGNDETVSESRSKYESNYAINQVDELTLNSTSDLHLPFLRFPYVSSDEWDRHLLQTQGHLLFLAEFCKTHPWVINKLRPRNREIFSYFCLNPVEYIKTEMSSNNENDNNLNKIVYHAEDSNDDKFYDCND